MDAVTGDNVIDSATLDSLNQLKMTARDYCLKWQKTWNDDNPEDPDQVKMGFDPED